LRRHGGGDPAIVIEGPVTEHLEVLSVALRRSLRIRAIESVAHAHAFDGLLLDPIDHLGGSDAGGFENGWHDIDDVMELRTDATRVFDVAGP
jgi:hypothetical protein